MFASLHISNLFSGTIFMTTLTDGSNYPHYNLGSHRSQDTNHLALRAIAAPEAVRKFETWITRQLRQKPV